ncbi:MAG: Mur ligase family protein, partial [Desulfobacterales bacterium]
MKLSRLIKAVKPIAVGHKGIEKNMDPEIKSVHYRAQQVQNGGLFVAIAGHAADGHDYVNEALQRGAVAVLSQKEISGTTINIRVADTRQALADIAACFFDYPSQRLTIIGITGTNGKTTTAYLIESMLQQAAYRVGVIGTINYRYADKIFASPVTTPESLDLQRILADMQHAGISHV